MVIDPTGKFVYVANRSSNNVSAYAIDVTQRRADAGARVAVWGGQRPLWNSHVSRREWDMQAAEIVTDASATVRIRTSPRRSPPPPTKLLK